jgi:hypothetical protein
MSKKQGSVRAASSRPQNRSQGWIIGLVLAGPLIGGILAINQNQRSSSPKNVPETTANSSPKTNTPPSSAEVNTALMVTVELDFGGPVPTIAEAIQQIERRHQPDAGTGRVFAILDAYGEPTPDGKKLHMSMHVSMERPGIGSLIFKRTGETLWTSQIVSSTNHASSFAGNALTILLDDGSGRLLTVDGSKNPSSILEAGIKELGRPVGEIWNEGAEFEVTFLYSACGCPVKVKCRRTGDRTERTKDLPVIFPDDPSVLVLIHQLMRW